MDRATAEKMHELVSKMFDQANEVLYLVNNSSDAADLRKKVHQVLGSAIAELDLEILEPIYKQFPDLRPPDMEEVRG